MKTVKIIAKYQKERDALVLALAGLGYKVWCVEVLKAGLSGYEFLVFFEVDDEFVLEKNTDMTEI